MKKKNFNNIALWSALGLLLLGVLYSLGGSPLAGKKPATIAFSQMLQEAKGGLIASVDIQQSAITGKYKSGVEFESYAPEKTNYVDSLNDYGVKITAKPKGRIRGLLLGMLISWSPFLILIALWFLFMRQMQGGSGVMGFGQSRAKLLKQNRKKVTFKDVAGVDEACDELREVVDFLKNPRKFARLGGHIPRGVLLVGAPGTGKTLMARAVAGEASAPFFSVSGSDFVEMFVGVGASRVRDMFQQARKEKPCIVFVDEIDAVGRHRGAGLGGSNDEREQTLNQLLVEMDGFHPHEGIIVIAATNRPDVLDPALLRPGRFDRQVVVPLPHIDGRKAILEIHINNRKMPLASDVNIKTLARGTPGFTGADLENLVNEAALLATRKEKRLVTMEDFENAKDKVMMGSERRSLVMTDEDKKLTAYHEGGHAIVALHMPASDKIHKATIIPRGRALGMVVRLPERDPLSITRAKMKADLCVAMGGRVAEEMIFGYDKVTSGASSDIKAATSLARDMVTRYGMSDKLGPLAYGDNEDEVFLGHSVTRKQNISEQTLQLVDKEIHLLVQEAYDGAKHLLKKYEKDLHCLAKALLRYETLDGEEIAIVLKKGKLPKEDQTTPKSILFPEKTPPPKKVSRPRSRPQPA